MKILITGCNSLRKPIVDSLKNNRDGREVYVVGIDSSEQKILRDGVNQFRIAPRIDSDGYVDWLAELCESEGIDIVIPFLQAELPLAAEYKERLEAVGTKVSIASKETLAAVNSKVALHDRYPEYMPRQAVCKNSGELLAFANAVGYPSGESKLCCKLADEDGAGGIGFAIIDEEKWMDVTLWGRAEKKHYAALSYLCQIIDRNQHEVIVQEYIEGRDYNTVLLADHGSVVSICGFSGDAMEHGAYTSGQMEKNEEAFEISRKIVEDTKLDGNACFDFVIANNSRLYLLECNPRLSAGLAFPNAAGADYAYQRCKMLLGEKYVTDYRIDYDLKMVLCRDYSFYKS